MLLSAVIELETVIISVFLITNQFYDKNSYLKSTSKLNLNCTVILINHLVVMKRTKDFINHWSFNQFLLKIKLIIFFLFLFIGGFYAEAKTSEGNDPKTNTLILETKNGDQDNPVKYVIKGSVKDETNYSLPGVSVSIKGTTTGTITDSNGNFVLKNVPKGSVLLFSFIGLKSQEVTIVDDQPLDILLASDLVGLDEVVAVGYGTQKKKDLTGSIGKVNIQTSEMSATTDLSQILQGATPGLNAKSGSGAGDTGGLSIRGKTSLSASDSPMIVVDGIIYEGSTADLNFNDIESIDVLKDASAAAVYGCRSANGVIAITTKRGKSEKPKFNFNAYYGLQNLSNTDRTKVMNADQYAVKLVDYYYQQDLYDWYDTNPTSATDRPERPDVTDKELVADYLLSDEEKENYLAGKSVDWIDEVYRVAPIQSYNLSVSGSSEKTNYYLSTSYTNQEGILVNDKFQKLTFFSKLESQLTDWFKIVFNPVYSHRDYSGLSASASYALIASPLGNEYDEGGDYPVYIANESYAYHPLGNTLATNSEPRDNINLILKGTVDVPWIKGLKYDVNFSRNYIISRSFTYYPTTCAIGQKNDGLGYKNYSETKKWLLNNIVTYDNLFADKHHLNVTLLQSRENTYYDATSTTAYGFDNETLGYYAMDMAETQEISTSTEEEDLLSFMGRLNYSFDDKYLLTATIRRDGYSGFGSNNKYASFPSISLGWIATDESFLDDSKWLNFLKIRLSYGINGNQGIGRYASQSEMSTTSTVFDGSTAVGVYSSSMGNDDLKWEKTASINSGVDFGFLNNRITGSIDVYNAKTTDVLVERSIPTTSGNSSVWTNIGGVENNGIEISLTTENIKSPNLTWKTTFTYARNRNKLTKLYDDVTEDIDNGWFVGHSTYALYGYKTQGIWQEDDLFDGDIMDGYYPGQFNIKDLDDSGTITADGDRSIVGETDPNYRFSISSDLRYKNLSLNIFVNSIQGGNGYYMGSNTSAVVAGGTDKAYRLNRTAVRDYWRPDNPVNNAPAMYYNPKISPAVYQDKSFVRLQDISLAYNFSKGLLDKLKMENLKVYVSGRNLYTWTKWSGWDPDTGSPMMRSVIGGVNVSF